MDYTFRNTLTIKCRKFFLLSGCLPVKPTIVTDGFGILVFADYGAGVRSQGLRKECLSAKSQYRY
jgi:hypothetical protein